MSEYLFDTSATMKPYNHKKWWIDKDIIPQMHIKADTVEEALKIYQERVDDEHGVCISNNALKTKEPMYIDVDDEAKQVGYVITASTEFGTDRGYWSSQYIDLWVRIYTFIDTVF